MSAMNKSNVLRYKNRLLSERQKLSAGKGRVDLIPSADELHGDMVDMATYETDAPAQIWRHQTDGKLLHAIDDALMRILDDEFSICEECRQPISKARLEAVPWTRWCRDCKERQES